MQKKEAFYNLKSFFLKKENLLFLFILFIGIFARMYMLSSLPGGVNQDEAFTAYEAFCLSNYGVDSFLYKNPVYFTTWGSGMSSTQIYITSFFFNFFGSSIFTLRFAQSFFSILSLVAFYFLLKDVFDKTTALLGFFLLSISPYHIMEARWVLEAHYSVYFFIFALLFFVKGVSDNRYFILSSLMFVLSMYSYAIHYLIVPLTLTGFILYMLISKKKFSFFYALSACLIIIVFSIPLLLFILVNNGYLNEIITPFFSIPLLPQIRSSDVSLSNLMNLNSLNSIFDILVFQNDNHIWNTTKEYGLFYPLTSILIPFGIFKTLKDSISKIKNKIFSKEFFFIILFIVCIFSYLLIAQVNSNRANFLAMLMLVFITQGFIFIYQAVNKHAFFLPILYSFFFALFLSFFGFYSSHYNNVISPIFKAGAYEAVQFADSINEDEIIVDSSIYFPQVLFADETSPFDYQETVVFKNYPASFLDVASFTKYYFGIDYNNLSKDCYISPNIYSYYFEDADYFIENFSNYIVAYNQ